MSLTTAATTSVTKPEPAWFQAEWGPRLKPSTRELYRKWSGLSGDALNTRLHEIRKRAWPHADYPCIGSWMFLLPSISAFKQYPKVVAQARQGEPILDLGCCFGQDLRLLAAEGAPTDKMYASDVLSELWELGFELFGDKDRMHAKFIKADVMAPTSGLDVLDGKLSIIIACNVLHLWNWEGQLVAMKRLVRMSKVGTMVVGFQRAREDAQVVPYSWGQMLLHDPGTFHEIWKQLGEETNTTWDVDSTLVTLDKWGMEPEDYSWMDHPAMGLNFVVTRLA